MQQSAMSVISTMWDRQVLNWKMMTTSRINDQAALKLHYANKNSTSSKNFEEAYSITFTDSTSNHTNLGYLVNLLKTNVSTSKTILLF